MRRAPEGRSVGRQRGHGTPWHSRLRSRRRESEGPKRSGAIGRQALEPRSGETPRAPQQPDPPEGPTRSQNTRSLIGRASGGTPKLTMPTRADEEVNPHDNSLAVVQRCRDGVFSADLAAGPRRGNPCKENVAGTGQARAAGGTSSGGRPTLGGPLSIRARSVRKSG